MYLVRKRALGDVLWTEPVIRSLASRHKRVTVVTRYNDLFLHYPLPNVSFRPSLTALEKLLIRLERLLGTRCCSIDLDGSYEASPHQHFLTAYQKRAGLPITREYPRLYLSNKERDQAPGVEGPFVILHLESFADKNYRKVYGIDWADIVERLRGSGYQVVQIGQHPEPIPGTILRTTTLRDLIALVSKASFFIGLDSGPSHLAAALGVPVLLFFGAVNPEFRHFTELLKGIILQQPCPFAGCFHDAGHPEKMVCRLVGDTGTPICCLHTTPGVWNAIEHLRQTFVC